jgi:hypothetical protein
MILGTLSLLLPATWIPQVPATAVACVSGSASNYFSGFQTESRLSGQPTYEGSSASIYARTQSICDTGAYDFNTTWSMIAPNSSSGIVGHVQVGFFRNLGTCTYFFTEYQESASDTFHRTIHTSYGCIPEGHVNKMWNQYYPSTGLERMNVDTTNMATTPFGIYSAWTQPFDVVFSGETTNLATNVPGTTSVPVTINNMMVQRYTDDVFTSSIPSPSSWGGNYPYPCRYSLSPMSGGAFTLWTNTNSGYNVRPSC